MRRLTVYIILLLQFSFWSEPVAQEQLHFIQSEFFDSFSRWILVYDDEQEGTVELKWPTRNDWTQWTIDVGEYYGTVKQVALNNPNHWQSKINGAIIDFRTTYPGELRHWSVRHQSINYKLYLPHPNQPENWTLESKSEYFDMFTSVEGDPRDWSFELSPDNTIPMELQISTIALILSVTTPNF